MWDSGWAYIEVQDNPPWYAPGWTYSREEIEGVVYGMARLVRYGPAVTGEGECWERTPSDGSWAGGSPPLPPWTMDAPGAWEVPVTCAELWAGQYEDDWPWEDADPWTDYTCDGEGRMWSDGAWTRTQFLYGEVTVSQDAGKIYEYRIEYGWGGPGGCWGFMGIYHDGYAVATQQPCGGPYTRVLTGTVGCAGQVRIEYMLPRSDPPYGGESYLWIRRRVIAEIAAE